MGAGIWHTDLLVTRDGHVPILPRPSLFGHEAAVVVESVGSRVTKAKPGEHVALTWDYRGACRSCESGRDAYCLDFFVDDLHGGSSG